MQQGRAKLLFSFDLSVKVKAKQEFSTPNASRKLKKRKPQLYCVG